MKRIHDIWVEEDIYVDDFAAARQSSNSKFSELLQSVRSIHFLLKPTEDGTAEIENLPPPAVAGPNVDLIPGRLTLHLYEAKVGERWSGIYQGDPLAIRTATRVRTLAHEYAARLKYEIVIFDTSPSLGALNRDLITLADGFLIPCAPDLFSVYGIRNIGSALSVWKKQFESIFHFLSDAKRIQFPSTFVKFIGYTLYNARKYSGSDNDLDLARAHNFYADQIPKTIADYIREEDMINLPEGVLSGSIGDNAIIHSHNTFPSMSQKYHVPMWRLPDYVGLEGSDKSTISGNRQKYVETRESYHDFATDFLKRIERLD